jgi:hypothetical protein
MRKLLVTVLVATAVVVGWTIVHGPFAQEAQAPRRSMMGDGMMGGRGMMGGMNMMGQMSQMRDHCSQMMGRAHGSGRPNEQWRQQTPKTPEKRG